MHDMVAEGRKGGFSGFLFTQVVSPFTYIHRYLHVIAYESSRAANSYYLFTIGYGSVPGHVFHLVWAIRQELRLSIVT